ncbi:MAG: caspase family protein [Cyclobacteriaceae bacterium]|nr:caspase family protein [Cyclobacteriaceae bacterium]MDH4297494.1 caspase family protein [Cyclobacteriaceae bacterium]MDH5248441.1 caspase family protein [Cyclobacteriaceae bacterium]
MNKKKCVILLVLTLVSATGNAQFKLYKKGHDSYTNENYADAIYNFSEYLTKATRDKSLDVDVFYLRALAYYKSNNFANAIDDFEESILLDHQNKGNIYWFLAKCNDKTDNLAESLSAYNNAVRLLDADKASSGKLLYERSHIYERMGKLPLAYADLKRVASLDPDNTAVKGEIEKLEQKDSGLRSTAVSAKPNPAAKTDAAKNENPLPKNNLRMDKKEETIPQEAEAVAIVPPPVQKPVVAKSTLADFYKDEKRFALVIGNSAYPKDIGVLKNPVNDATDLAEELRNSNFEVQLLTNATYGQIRAAMLRFKERVDENERDKTVSLFYYAGHGLQSEDENYLVPIDARVEYEDDIVRYCFPVQRMVLANMERSNARMNIVILDACRNNPFPALTRSLGQVGLGEMRRARGSFIAYATAPGSVASDGPGRNGLYTQELLKAMRKPGLTIEQVFKEVRQNVLRLSGDKQNTWDTSNIIGDFYFKFN